MQSTKRKGSPGATAARRGMFAQMKFSKAQPWTDYGAMRVQRGTAANIERFGATARGASVLQKERRKMTGYTGRGKYGMKTFGKIYKAATSKPFVKGLKRGVGAGADLLAALTPLQPELAPVAAAAEGFSGMIGRGMYAPKKHGVNDLIVGGASSVPMMSSVDDETGSLMVSHRERVADIIAPGDDKFHVQSYTVQAGLESTFPWLHQLAASYEEYEVMQCVFEYRGHEIVGIQNTLDLQGQVIAATKYNVKSKSFADRHEMQAYPHAASCSLNGTLQAGVEAAPGKIAAGDTHKYVRTGGLLEGESIVDYDHARFELALNNTPTDLYNKEVGQLFVYYTIKLSKPKISAGRGRAISTYQQFATRGTTGYGPNQYPFGLLSGGVQYQALVASRNSLDMTYSIPGADTAKWEFPASANGRYQVTLFVQGANLEDAATDFGAATGAPVVAGEVTLATKFIGGGVSGFSGAHALEDSNTHAVLVFDVLVRPQVGATKNSFSITNMKFSEETSDAVIRASVTVAEINDMDSPSATPEVVGMVDRAIRVLE